MMMNPPTLPTDYVPPVHADELIRALVLIWHATSPTWDDDGHHEAAHDLADAILKRWEARARYDAKQLPAPNYQPRLTPVGAGDGNTYVVG